jgi:site-specific recombinase XerD
MEVLELHRDDPPPKAPLIATNRETKMQRRQLLRRLQKIGERAGLTDITVHRFRHTFAIQFLRNGGNIFALQQALGHSTLNMVRRYLAIVDSDMEKTHQIASPITNWGL